MKRILRVRLKIIFSIVAVLAFILAAVLGLLNIALIRREMSEAMAHLQQMAVNGGHPVRQNPSRLLRLFRMSPQSSDSLPPGDGDDVVFPIRLEIGGFRNSFAVKLSEKNQIVKTFYAHPLPYSNRELNELVDKILLKKDEKGLVDGMLFYTDPLAHGEKLICIANMHGDLFMFRVLVNYSVVVFILAIVIASVFAWVLSGFIVRPIQQAFFKQKEFISNAGHELKTPIAVIGANLDVLLADYGGNKWLQYIKAENERMGELVKDLLYLARADADRHELTLCPFDFSMLVETSVLPFESVIFEQHKTLSLNVQKGMRCVGDERQIKQVVMILLDNAIKNSESGASIRVTSYQDGKTNVVTVYNEGHGIPKEDFEKIFERFYRSDSSRARNTGGYGLGLPIARTIAHAHNGSITVASKYGEWAEFTFTLPCG